MTRKVDLLVRGGNVALPGGVARADLAIDGGKFVAIGDAGAMPAAKRTLDVGGADVIPGAIDGHVHFNTKTPHVDDLGDAAISGAHGGLTTVVGHLLMPQQEPTEAGIRHFIDVGRRRAPTDFGFHLILWPRPSLTPDIETAWRLGITTFKMFTVYSRRGFMLDDGLIWEGLRTIAAKGGLALVHCENGAIVDRLEDVAQAEGRVKPADYPPARPPILEAETMARVLRYATDARCPLYVVHVSSREGMAVMRAAKRRGLRVWGECCPQYLMLDASLMETWGPLAKMAPPLRTAADHEALWEGMRRGELDTCGSDHCPYRPEDKAVGNDNIFKAPYGVAGIETLVPSLYSEGARRRGLGIGWLARVLSEMPARLFGFYPRKGAIAVGADADLTILDPGKRVTIRGRDLHSNAGYTLFEGREMEGWPVLSTRRGRVLLDHGALASDAGPGEYLARPGAVVT
jgi:D-hydantoinase